MNVAASPALDVTLVVAQLRRFAHSCSGASRRTDDDAGRWPCSPASTKALANHGRLAPFAHGLPPRRQIVRHIPFTLSISPTTPSGRCRCQGRWPGLRPGKDVRSLGEVVVNHLHAAPSPPQDEAGLRAHTHDTGLAFLNPTVGGMNRLTSYGGQSG